MNSVGNFDGDGKIQWKSNTRRSRRGGVGSGLGEDFRACQPPCGLALGAAFRIPKEDLAGTVRFFEHQRRVMRGKAANHHFGDLARVQVELFAFAQCVTGCTE